MLRGIVTGLGSFDGREEKRYIDSYRSGVRKGKRIDSCSEIIKIDLMFAGCGMLQV